MAGAATVTPAAIEIRRNHLYKPLIWKPGTSGYITGNSSYLNVVKNLLELKSAQRVLVDGNIMEYTWGGFSQAGYGVLLTPKNQTIGTTNVCPMCQVTDVTIRYTTISRVAAGFQIANALSDGGGAPLAGERYIHDITVDDINGIKYGGSGLFALVAMLNNNVPVLCDVQFDHVTAFAPQHMLVIGDLAGNSDIATFVVENSILNTGPYPVWSTGGLTNCAISDKPLAIFSPASRLTPLPTTRWLGLLPHFPLLSGRQETTSPSTTQVQFTSYNGGTGGNYQLLSSSPYKNAGTDGKDLGADLTAIRTATAGVY